MSRYLSIRSAQSRSRKVSNGNDTQARPLAPLLIALIAVPQAPLLAQEVSTSLSLAPQAHVVHDPVSLPSADPTSPSTLPLEASQADASGLMLDPNPSEGIEAVQSPGDPPFTYVQPQGDRQELRPTVDQSTGALVYPYVFRLPPGRRGMTPTLSLIYNSQATQEENIAGYGWFLDLPYIERLNVRGTDTFYTGSSTDFVSSPWGRLSQISGSSYGVTIQDGQFLAFTYTGGTSGTWTLQTPDGRTHTFGTSFGPYASQQYNPNNSSQVFRWYLEKSVDTHGNAIEYFYTYDQGHVYPTSIKYTSAPGTSGLFQISFSYAARPDIITSNAPGFPVTITKRLNQIQVSRTDSNALFTIYTLGYTQDARNNRLLLTSITETGYDELGVASTRPPTNFSYTSDQFAYTRLFPNDTPAIWGDAHDLGIVFADVNGDAYPDAIKATNYTIAPFSQIKEAYENLSYQSIPGGVEYPYLYGPLSKWVPPLFICNVVAGTGGVPVGDAQGAVVTDVNGEPRADFVYSDSTSSQNSQVYVNTGTDWTLDPIWNGQVQPLDPTYTGYRPHLGDVTGDGLVDQIQILGGFVFSADVYKNIGTGFSIISFGSGITNGTGIRSLDFNHDGRTDLIQSSDTAGQTLLPNSGNSFINVGKTFGGFSMPQSNFPLFEDSTNGIHQAIFADLNGDHLDDFIDRNGWIWLHNGLTWIRTSDNAGTVDSIVDLNADGLNDLIINSCSYFPKYCGTWIWYNSGKVPDLLQSITLPTGGTIQATYKSSARYLVNNVFRANPNLPIVVMTVESLTEADPVTGVSGTTTYAYEGGSFYFGGPFDRRFAGFEKATATRPDGSQIATYSHQGNGPNVSYFEPIDHASLIGKAYRTDVIGSGSLLQRTTTQWTYTSLGSVNNDRYFVNPTQTTIEDFDGTSTARSRAKTFVYDHNLGLFLSEADYGEVIVTTPPFFSDSIPDLFIQSVYGHTYSGPVLPVEDQLFEDGQLISKRVRFYDNLPLGQATLGDLTSVEDWITADGLTKATTSYVYDSLGTGNLFREFDPNGNAVTYHPYDAFNLYPTSITNALNQIAVQVYGYSSGKVTQTTDPNGEVRETKYDAFDRVIAERAPDPQQPGLLVTTRTLAYADYNGPTSPQAVTEVRFFNPGLAVDAVTYLDGFGRAIQRRARAEDQNQLVMYAVSDTVYDSTGRVARASLPYFAQGAGYTMATSDPTLYQSFTYDGLDRVRSVTDALGTTTTAYDDWTETITDPKGNVKRLGRDAFDRLVRVEEYPVAGGPAAVTSYTYDATGNLTRITDANGNVRKFTYDLLRRRLSAEDIHDPSDTTFGIYAFTYDVAGNLLQKLDPNGNFVVYSYDSLNRLISEDLQGQSGIEITRIYDQCIHGKGRLCTSTAGSVRRRYDYDLAGNRSKDMLDIGGASYATFYEYDFQGNQTTITNPDSSQHIFMFNKAGLPDRASVFLLSQGTSIIVQNVDYAPTAEVAKMAFANGVEVHNAYDFGKLYRLVTRTLLRGGNLFKTWNYQYDPVGNVLQVDEGEGSAILKTSLFGYDDLYRLTSAAVTSSISPSFNEAYSYDAIGNILVHSAVGGYSYAGDQGSSLANPHAVTQAGPTTFTYDQNGNLIKAADSSQKTRHSWNFRNQLIQTAITTLGTPLAFRDSQVPSVDSREQSSIPLLGSAHPRSNTVAYAYDADGVRVSLARGQAITVYATPSYNINTRNAYVTSHLFLLGAPVATIEGIAPNISGFINHADHLGSMALVTDRQGQVAEEVHYAPFGALVADLSSVNHKEQRKFTGHEHDLATGLTYAQSRYLNTKIGRFLSQDPMFLLLGDLGFHERYGREPGGVLADPQLLNCYGYSKNNPLRFVDPSGEVIVFVFLPVFLPVALKAYSFFDTLIDEYELDTAKKMTELFPGDPIFEAAKTKAEIEVALDLATFDIPSPLGTYVDAAMAVVDIGELIYERVNTAPFSRKDATSSLSKSSRSGAATNNFYPSLSYFQQELDRIKAQLDELSSYINSTLQE